MRSNYSAFADVYGAGTFNSNSYNSSTSSATGKSGSGGPPLANAGFDLLLGATIACVVIFAALFI